MLDQVDDINKEVSVTRADLIHLAMTLNECDRLETIKAMMPFYPVESDYVKYIQLARGDSTIAYQHLRKTLRLLQLIHESRLISTLNYLMTSVRCPITDIRVVYDLGSGLSVWPDILKKVFMNARIVRVDRENVMHDNDTSMSDTEFIEGDVPELLKANTVFETGPTTVFFMSEFLHCKIQHYHLLRLKNILTSWLCVNEVSKDEHAIDVRLHHRGGGLLPTYRIEQSAYATWGHVGYRALFRYYMVARGPVKVEE